MGGAEEVAWYTIVPSNREAPHLNHDECSWCGLLTETPNHKWLFHKTRRLTKDEVVILRLEGIDMEGQIP